MEYIFVAAAAISAIVGIVAAWKNGKKGTILKSIIKGVEESSKFVPAGDLKIVKNLISERAKRYGVGSALQKIVNLITKEE